MGYGQQGYGSEESGANPLHPIPHTPTLTLEETNSFTSSADKPHKNWSPTSIWLTNHEFQKILKADDGDSDGGGGNDDDGDDGGDGGDGDGDGDSDDNGDGDDGDGDDDDDGGGGGGDGDDDGGDDDGGGGDDDGGDGGDGDGDSDDDGGGGGDDGGSRSRQRYSLLVHLVIILLIQKNQL